MNKRSLLLRILAFFLSGPIGVSIPASALALRPAGVDDPSLKAGLQQALSAGAEETITQILETIKANASHSYLSKVQVALLKVEQEWNRVPADLRPIIETWPKVIKEKNWIVRIMNSALLVTAEEHLNSLSRNIVEAHNSVKNAPKLPGTAIYVIPENPSIDLAEAVRKLSFAVELLGKLDKESHDLFTKFTQVIELGGLDADVEAGWAGAGPGHTQLSWPMKHEYSVDQLLEPVSIMRTLVHEAAHHRQEAEWKRDKELFHSTEYDPDDFSASEGALTDMHNVLSYLTEVDAFHAELILDTRLLGRLYENTSLEIVEWVPEGLRSREWMNQIQRLAQGSNSTLEAIGKMIYSLEDLMGTEILNSAQEDLVNKQRRRQTELEQFFASYPFTGLEERVVKKSLAVFGEAVSKPGVVVIDAGMFPQQAGLEELLKRLPVEGRIVVIGAMEGSAAMQEIRARNGQILLADSLRDAVPLILSLPAAEVVSILGADAFARVLQADLRQFMIEAFQLDPRLGLGVLLRSLGVPEEVLRQLDWTSLEAALSSLEAA